MARADRKQQEWLEIPTRSRQRKNWSGEPVKIYRDGRLLSFVTAPDRDTSRINTFDVDDLRCAIEEFDSLPPKPDGALG